MNDEHLKKLRKMLEQVDPTAKAKGLSESLKRAKKKKGLETEMLRTQAGESSTPTLELVSESLDRFSRDKKLNKSQQMALESIVMPFHRPVVDIHENKMVTSQLSEKWQHLHKDKEIKSRIETALLSIGRIELPKHKSLPYAGTGFVVSDDLIMTNRHVAEHFVNGLGKKQLRFKAGQTAGVDFLREINSQKSEFLIVEEVKMIHPFWDMAILRVKGLRKTQKNALKLSQSDPSELKDKEVVVIGYPGYDPSGDAAYQNTQARIFRNTYYVKRLQPGNLRTRDDVESFGRFVPALTHDCSTLGGNSGSAIIDLSSGNVIGLHFAGAYLVANYAVPTFDLASDPRVVDAGVNFVGKPVATNNAYDQSWSSADSESPPQTTSVNTDVGGHSHIPNSPLNIATNGTVQWTVPLNISIEIGKAKIVEQPLAAQLVTPTQAEGLFGPPPRTFSLSELARLFSPAALTSADFNWRTALSLAAASKLAYESSAVIEAAGTQDWGLDTCRFVESGDTQAFVGSTSDVILVSFRGTESLGDWIENIRALPTEKQPFGNIHTGFLRGFERIQPQLESVIADFSARPVVITGHSLGGALSYVAAAHWKNSFPVLNVYTFGQPAVGQSDFKSFMEQNYANQIFRFVNDDDIVPKVPPGYSHLGKLIHFGPNPNQPLLESLSSLVPDRVMTDDEYQAFMARYEIAKMEAGGNRLLESLGTPVEEGLLPSFRDHKLDRYLEKILAKVGTP